MRVLKSTKFWGLLVFFLLAFYTLAGFFLVPYLITNVLPQKLDNQTNVNGSIQKATFNPFTFALKVQNANFLQNKKPLLKVENLELIINPMELFSKTISFEKILISKPEIHTIIAKDGKLNLLTMVKNQQTTKTSSPTTWNVSIVDISIKNGNLAFKDEREKHPFTFSLNPINYEGKNLSTKKGSISPQKLVTKGMDAKNLSIDANLTISPFKTQGNINIESILVENLWNYGLGKEGFYPKKALANISLSYLLEVKKSGLGIDIDDIAISLNEVEIYKKEDKVSKIKKINFNDASLKANISKEKKSIRLTKGNLKIEGIKAFSSNSLNLDANIEKFSLFDILFDFSQKNGIKLGIKKGGLKDGEFSYNDKKDGIDGIFKTLDLKDFSLHVKKDTILALQHITLDNLKLGKTNLLDTPFEVGLDRFDVKKLDFTLADKDYNLLVKDIDLDSLELKNKNLPKPSLHVKSASLKDSTLLDGKYIGNSLNLKGANFILSMEKDKTFDFLKGYKNKSETNSTFEYELKTLNIEDTKVDFSDKSLSTPFHKEITSLKLELTDILSKNSIPIKYKLSAKDDKSLTLNSKGDIFKSPLHVKADFYLLDKDLPATNPYLKEFTNLTITKGEIESSGSVDYEQLMFKIKSDSMFKNMDVKTEDLKPFFNFSKLDIKGFDFNQAKDKMRLKNIKLANSKSYIFIDKNGKANIKNILKSKQKKVKKSKTKFIFDMDNFDVKNGEFYLVNGTFKDKSDLHVKKIDASLKHFYLSKKQNSTFNFKGLVQDSGYLSVDANLIPKDIKKDTKLNINLKDLDAHSISPYAQRYIDYSIKDGKISSNYNQNIKDGKLQGVTNINLSSVHLGKKANNKTAIQIPLDLAFLVLRDRNGDINLDIPISGDMNDPTFNYGLIIINTVKNIITSIVSSPFSLLGNILGIDGEKLKTMDFEASSFELLPSEKDKFKQYKDILEKHPNLKLTIRGTYDKDIDLSKKDDLEKFINLANQRAKTIEENLLKFGIPKDKIIIEKPKKTKAKYKKWVECKIGIKI